MIEYTKNELVALNTFLAHWGDDLSYVEVIDQLKDDSFDWGDIDANASFEDLPPEHLAQLITDLHDYLIQIYGVQS